MKTNDNTYFLTLENTGKTDPYGRFILEWHYYPYDNDYKALQEQVGGFFDHFDIFAPNTEEWHNIHGLHHIDSWINDEGKLLNLPLTIPLTADGRIFDFICGNICFLRSDEMGESYGLKLSEMLEVMRAFHFAYELPFRLTVNDCTGFTGNPTYS